MTLWSCLRIVAATTVISGGILTAQTTEAPIELTITLENWTLYRGVVFDPLRLGTDPGPTTSVPTPFTFVQHVADVTEVNGKPAKGLYSGTLHNLVSRVRPAPGQFIADLDTDNLISCSWRLLDANGTFVGTLYDLGAGPAQHSVITGGGAFLGAWGEHRTVEIPIPPRTASTAEDPSLRRQHGGGKWRLQFLLFPRFRPQVERIGNRPAVFHSDFSPVTAENPLRPGETAIIRATGVGPVTSMLNQPGFEPFSATTIQEVASPVEVLLNGVSVPVINKIAWPGTVNSYRIDFQVPPGSRPGESNIRLVAGWIPGSEVAIPIR